MITPKNKYLLAPTENLSGRVAPLLKEDTSPRRKQRCISDTYEASHSHGLTPPPAPITVDQCPCLLFSPDMNYDIA